MNRMDRLISEQAVINAICKVCAVEVKPSECRYSKGLFGGCKEYEAIKAIPSAEPYKGMTNGEVIMAVKGEAKVIDNKGYKLITFNEDWWNSPYSPQESEG